MTWEAQKKCTVPLYLEAPLPAQTECKIKAHHGALRLCVYHMLCVCVCVTAYLRHEFCGLWWCRAQNQTHGGLWRRTVDQSRTSKHCAVVTSQAPLLMNPPCGVSRSCATTTQGGWVPEHHSKRRSLFMLACVWAFHTVLHCCFFTGVKETSVFRFFRWLKRTSAAASCQRSVRIKSPSLNKSASEFTKSWISSLDETKTTGDWMRKGWSITETISDRHCRNDQLLIESQWFLISTEGYCTASQ